MPAMPKTAVKMSSTKTLAKLETGAAQPRIRAAAAGDGQVASVTKAGEVLLKKPQQANYCMCGDTQLISRGSSALDDGFGWV